MRTPLAKIRKQKGYTQQTLAQAITAAGHPVSGQAVYTWEAGISRPRWWHAAALEAVLGVPIDTLLPPAPGAPPSRPVPALSA